MVAPGGLRLLGHGSLNKEIAALMRKLDAGNGAEVATPTTQRGRLSLTQREGAL